MAVLVDLIPEKAPVSKKTKKEYAEKASKLLMYRNHIISLTNEYGIDLEGNEKARNEIVAKESSLYQELWNDCEGTLPDIEELDKSCFGEEMRYTQLTKLKRYPTTTVKQLKHIADKLGFIIVSPIYTNMDEILKLYEQHDERYADEVRRANIKFREVMTNVASVVGSQRYYLLCPTSFYDPWKEITAEKRIPMYFGEGLEILKTTLGMTIPSQRNLYKMISKTNDDIATIKTEVDQMKKTMNDFHNRLSWVENMVKQLKGEMQEQNESFNLKLNNISTRVRDLEIQVACLLDPIYCCIPGEVDISTTDGDDAKVIIGSCFGVDMPIEFFAEKGLTIYNNRDMDYIKRALKGVLTI